MDTTNCTGCNKAIGGSDINYTGDGRVVCQACLISALPGAGGALVREYEFDMTENDTIRTLASPMRFVGVISVVFGVLNALAGMLAFGTLRGALTVGEGIALIAVGAWLAGAASSLRDVVNTEGSDITNLMVALRKLRSAYTLQAWLMGIACGLIVVILLLAILH